MLSASVLFALMALFVRMASARGAHWSVVAFARSFFGLVVAVSAALSQGRSLRVQGQLKAWGRSLCGTTSLFCTFSVYAAPQISLGDAASIGATGPIFVALLAPFVLHERTGRRTWAAMSLAFAGVVILARPHFDLSPHLVLVALLGAFSSACAMMFLRTLGPSETPEAVAAHFSLIATLASLAVAIPHLNWPGTTGALLLAGSGITAGLGQLLMTRAYGYDGAARLGALGYTGTALTQILAILFLAETPGPLQILGTALVIGAGLILAVSSYTPNLRSSSSSTPG